MAVDEKTVPKADEWAAARWGSWISSTYEFKYDCYCLCNTKKILVLLYY